MNCKKKEKIFVPSLRDDFFVNEGACGPTFCGAEGLCIDYWPC
jgi:hypothetical protein